MPSSLYCLSSVIADCPVYFGKDGSLTYLNLPFGADPNTQPSLIWLTASGTSTHKQLPADALSSSAAFDGAGNFWYMRTLSRTQVAVGRMDSSGRITNYPYQPSTLDIVAGRDGTIWLNDRVTRSILHISPDGVVRTYAIPGLATDVLTQLVPGSDGSVWFYELHSGTVGHLLPDGTFIFIPTKLQGTPVRLLIGAHNTAWLLASSLGIVEHLSPTGAEKSFTLDLPTNDVRQFAVGGDDSLYFSLSNQLGHITQHGDQHLYPIPTLDATVQGLVAGRDGHLWFSEMPMDPEENWSIIGDLVP